MNRTSSLAMVVLSAAVLLAGLVGCAKGGGGSSSTAESSAAKKSTKAEWKAKFGSKFGQTAQMGIVENLKPDQFKSVMGSPDRTQTIGDDAFWYYECSDGMIQLELFAPNLAVGMMQGKINDY